MKSFRKRVLSFNLDIDNKVLIGKKGSVTETLQLRLVSKEELLNFRLSEQPGFVFKDNELLYYTSIPFYLFTNSLDFLGVDNINMLHLCDTCGNLNCRKTFDGSKDFVLRFDFSHLPSREIIELSNIIEKYPFINKGYEFFNLPKNNVLFIYECDNYKTPTRI